MYVYFPRKLIIFRFNFWLGFQQLHHFYGDANSDWLFWVQFTKILSLRNSLLNTYEMPMKNELSIKDVVCT